MLDILGGTKKGARAKELLKGNEVFTSVICKCEFLNVASKSKFNSALDFASKIMTFPISLDDGGAAVEIQSACRDKGAFISSPDALIAAAAFNRGGIVLSSDADFERIDSIRKVVLKD